VLYLKKLKVTNKNMRALATLVSNRWNGFRVIKW